MIVDGNGKMFEDRRKKSNDRRENRFDAKGGRRGEDRRKAPKQVPDIEPEKRKNRWIKSKILRGCI